METKKVYFNLWVRNEVKRAIEAQASREDRSPSNLSDRLLGWCVKFLERAGNSEALMTWEAGERAGTSRPAIASGRVSEETQLELFAALETILRNAPSPVIEDAARYLIARAGKYGDEREGAMPQSRKTKRA